MTDKLEPSRNVLVPTANNSLATRSSSLVKRGLEALGSKQPHVGTLTYPNGDRYVGEYRDGKCNGHGTHTSANGDRYVGEFKDNTYDGFGILYRADGSVLQSGIWKDGGFIIRN